MIEQILETVRHAAFALPDVEERLSHGAPSFFITGKKQFAMFATDHHGAGRPALWCPAPAGVQGQLVDEEPDRFFAPPYFAHRGWIGLWLDVDLDKDEIAMILKDAYRVIAPKSHLKLLEAE